MVLQKTAIFGFLVAATVGVSSRVIAPAIVDGAKAEREAAALGNASDKAPGAPGDTPPSGTVIVGEVSLVGPPGAERQASSRDLPSGAACPVDMVRVTGSYCPEVDHTCTRWMDPPPYQNLRCATYETTARCLKPKVPMQFCIDRQEHTQPGETLAQVSISFVEAKAACVKEGKHLCKEEEWQFACEGEEMRPYPYGFSRDSTACNIDQTNLGAIGKNLRDLRAPNDAFERCVSPFGVHNMTGNVDEWVEADGYQRSVLHGGWWLPGRNRCRATTREHGPEYSGTQVGYRCCK